MAKYDDSAGEAEPNEAIIVLRRELNVVLLRKLANESCN